ncbi:MAG: hypothetical protein QNJ22_04220 [Desulfosarcinaceae bacterium]|nr:hypothetical protein [Desulfosarcinaceae bacterium]
MLHRSIRPFSLTWALFFVLFSLTTVTAAHAVVTLEWDANDPSPDGYRLFRRLDGDTFDYTAPLGTVTGTRFVDETTNPGETYHYVVRAYEGDAESGDSNEVTYSAPVDDTTGSGYDGDSASDTDNDNSDTITDQETPETRIGLTPLLSTTISVDGHQHTATRWQISLDETFTSLILDQVSEAQLTRYPVPDMVLETETVYYWRATYLDQDHQVLTQSSPAVFETITAADTDDLDANGLVDNQEVDGSELDLDGNGVRDCDQDDLSFVAAETGDGHLGLKVANDCAHVVGLKSVCPTQVSNTRNLPEMTDLGAVSFKLFLQEGQQEATVTVYFSEPAPEGTEWFKYNAELGWQLYENAEFSPDRRSVSYTLIDGGTGDDDGVVNGIIIDPAGLGYRQFADADSDSDTTIPAGNASASSGDGCFIGASAQAGGTPIYVIAAAIMTLIGGTMANRNRD